MRILVALVLSGALMVVGCSDDDSGSGGDAGSGGTAGTAGSGGTGGAGAEGGMGGMGGGGSELSVMVEWAPVGPCEQGTPSEYEVAVTPMNQVGAFTITGSVAACTPAIDTELNELLCPNNVPYPGTVTVADENGMVSVEFTIGVCESGSAP